MGGKLSDQDEPWTLSAEELWRAAPALARQARRRRLAPFGGSPARRCLSEPLDSAQLSQFVKEEHAACRASDRRRYNFDFETMRPLEGRFRWQPVSPPPPLVRSSQTELNCGSPVELGSQTVVVVRPAPELGRRVPLDGADRVPTGGLPPLESRNGAPRHTAGAGEWRHAKLPAHWRQRGWERQFVKTLFK